jgi:hypothetical protein
MYNKPLAVAVTSPVFVRLRHVHPHPARLAQLAGAVGLAILATKTVNEQPGAAALINPLVGDTYGIPFV